MLATTNSKLRIGPGVRLLEEPLKSIADFDHWSHGVLYNLRLDGDFKPYLVLGFIFGKKTREKPNRDLIADTTGDKKSAEVKCAEVDFMLEQIAQFCPKIPHNDITRDCGSLEDVWQTIRLHSNIETTGALLNNCWNITREANETPQALYSRVKQAYDDNLIRKNTLEYKGAQLKEDEEMSPTLHCILILHWLQILHPKLRDLVTQRFCTELRSVTYACIWPEISRSVDNLLKELSDSEGASVCRFGDSSFRPPSRARGSFSRYNNNSYRPAQGSSPTYKNSYRSAQSSSRQCDYCRVMGRRTYQTHNIDDCLFMKRDKSASSKAIDAGYDEHCEEFYEVYDEEASSSLIVTEHYINRIAIHPSPVLRLYHNNCPYDITLDTGGTCNVISSKKASELGCTVKPTFQKARMADGKSNLEVVGETEVELRRNDKLFRLNALVCNVVDTTILAGMPFLLENDVAIRPAKSQIIIDGTEVIEYNSQGDNIPVSCRITNYTLHSPSREVMLPGETTTYCLPASIASSKSVVVEPRVDASFNCYQGSASWPTPKVCSVSNGTISLTNSSHNPILIKRHEQVCIVHPQVPDEYVHPTNPVKHIPVSTSKKVENYSSAVKLNPDGILKVQEVDSFSSVLKKFDEVFNPVVSRYNGRSGPCFVEVNMGPSPPPQHKGRVPFYGRNNMLELQEKMDILAEKGVFRRPQEIGITVENVNPSFLVKKQDSHEKRLVTDFGSIASYCRPTPTLMPDVESTLRQIASWKYIIKTDLTEAYFQIPLKKSSMKYCGVVTPTKGILVYTAGCMGLPGVEVALEELTCLLFGELVKQGKLAKLADDMFIGASSPQELQVIFEEVLCILLENNLKLSARKTTIVPKTVTILGWIWSEGCLKASPHRLSALSECKPPDTVTALKSFLGAYRFLSRVIKSYASLLKPLEDMIIGKTAGSIRLEWSDDSLASFRTAQLALKDPKTIVLPTAEDILWIVTDAAVQPTAIGATLYAVREGTPKLAGFYNAKLPPFQRKWLPCEIEGVAIGASLKHFGPYIIQSRHKPCVLTDSRACVQAIDKLNRGEYSASARLCTFLSAVSRYQATVKHISGVNNLTSDYISRNPIACTDPSCQICKFLRDSLSSVVGAFTVSDVLSGKIQLPFLNKKAWVDIQHECPDLHRVFKYLQNGTSPGRKGKNLKTVRRYISSKVVISSEGALVVHNLQPLTPVTERIVIPEQVLHGVLTVLHIRLGHPTSYQLHQVFVRSFFALKLDSFIEKVSKSCDQCNSIRDIPKAFSEQSTEEPPQHVGDKYAADVVKRNKQNILILRECVSSYTQATLIDRETAADVSDGLIRLCNIMRPSTLHSVVIRVDPAPGNKSLFLNVRGDSQLKAQNIQLEVGREHNANKNPVAEKGIRELIRELLILSSSEVPVSPTTLSLAVANLNSRIRATGLSAHEVFTQREQTSGEQLSLDDNRIITEQQERRKLNHTASERSKAGGRPAHPIPNINVGSLVYLYSDGSKVKARSRYLVLSIKEGWCQLRRLTEKQLGGKTYSVKLEECYKVTDETDVELPPYPVPQSEADKFLPCMTVPLSTQVVKFPCTICKREVGDEDQALQCDSCSDWCHRQCCGMSPEAYRHHVNEDDFEWSCPTHEESGDNESEVDNHSEVEEERSVTENDADSIMEGATGGERISRNKKPIDRLGIDVV